MGPVYNDANFEEWERYQRDPVIAGICRQEAIKWWYRHRHTYPTLFKLAVSFVLYQVYLL